LNLVGFHYKNVKVSMLTVTNTEYNNSGLNGIKSCTPTTNVGMYYLSLRFSLQQRYKSRSSQLLH